MDLAPREIRNVNHSFQPIAIIGVGCRFPGDCDDAASYWELLRDGVDAIRETPEDRWSLDKFYSEGASRPGKTQSRWGGYVRDIATFDPELFGISPREAACMEIRNSECCSRWPTALPKMQAFRSTRWRDNRYPCTLESPASTTPSPGLSFQRSWRHRPLQQHRWKQQHCRKPEFRTASICAGERRDRHRVLVVSHCDSPRVSKPARQIQHDGIRGRR